MYILNLITLQIALLTTVSLLDLFLIMLAILIDLSSENYHYYTFNTDPNDGQYGTNHTTVKVSLILITVWKITTECAFIPATSIRFYCIKLITLFNRGQPLSYS